MNHLTRLIDNSYSINVNGAMSDSDSSGRNFYFALEEEAEERKKREPKEDFLMSSADSAELMTFSLMKQTVPQPSFSQEALHKISASFLVAFLPFRVPISLQ